MAAAYEPQWNQVTPVKDCVEVLLETALTSAGFQDARPNDGFLAPEAGKLRLARLGVVVFGLIAYALALGAVLARAAGHDGA